MYLHAEAVRVSQSSLRSSGFRLSEARSSGRWVPWAKARARGHAGGRRRPISICRFSGAGLDEVGQRRDVRSIRDRKAIAEVIPERDPRLVAGFHQPEETVPAVASALADGAAGEITADNLAADVALRAGCVSAAKPLGSLAHELFVGSERRKPLVDPTPNPG